MNLTKKLLIVSGVAAAATMIAPASASAQSYDDYKTDSGYSWNDSDSERDDYKSDNCQTNGSKDDDYSDSKSDGTIVETLVEDGDFTTLVTAVKAAGLADALNASGDKTVFAPTDEAFANLPAGTVEALLADIPTLTKILTYHVVDGSVDSDTAIELGEATTLNGQNVMIEERDDGVYVNDAKLEMTDIETSNGIIHVLDAVLMPKL